MHAVVVVKRPATRLFRKQRRSSGNAHFRCFRWRRRNRLHLFRRSQRKGGKAEKEKKLLRQTEASGGRQNGRIGRQISRSRQGQEGRVPQRGRRCRSCCRRRSRHGRR